MGTINLDDPTRYIGGTVRVNRPGVRDRRLAATQRLADLLDDLEREVVQRDPQSLTAYERRCYLVRFEEARAELAGQAFPSRPPSEAEVDAAMDEEWQATQ
jgi:hypothetical protein